MLTEQILRDHPLLVKALTGVPAETFWPMMGAIETQYPDYERHRHTRDQRQRAPGGGRPCDLPLVLRVTMLLFYLRTHVPQTLVALVCGATQSDVSRDLRRFLPLVREVLPTPDIWDLVADPAAAAAAEPQATPTEATSPCDRITTTHVLIDATEQEVARSQDSTTRKQYYSGKQKEFTLKTQLVNDADHHIVTISARRCAARCMISGCVIACTPWSGCRMGLR